MDNTLSGASGWERLDMLANKGTFPGERQTWFVPWWKWGGKRWVDLR